MAARRTVPCSSADLVRFDRRLRTSPHRFRKRPIGIVHLKDDVADAVAVLPEVIRGGMIGRQRRRQDEARPALLERVRGVGAASRFESAVGNLREAEGVTVEERRLLRIPDPELDVVDLSQLERVLLHAWIIVNRA